MRVGENSCDFILILFFLRRKFLTCSKAAQLLTFFSHPVTFIFQTNMGLREKRALNELKTVVVPKFQAELDSVLGFHIDLTIDWDSLPELEAPIEGIMRDDYAYSFQMIVEVLKKITIDDIGRNALQSSVESIVLVNYNKTGSDTGVRTIALANKRLEFHCGWGSYSSEYYDNYNDEVQHLIEDLL